MLSDLALKPLEKAINKYLSLDKEVTQDLYRYAGKLLLLEIEGLIPIHIYLLVAKHGVQLLAKSEQQADTIITGTPLAFLNMLCTKHKSDVFFKGEVSMKGDVAFGHALQNILQNMDVDWEEHLSHLIGDPLAHGIGKQVRRSMKWGQDSRERLHQDISEYLQEEVRLLPARIEIDNFNRDVSTLRHDAQRLEARLKRLQAQLGQRSDG